MKKPDIDEYVNRLSLDGCVAILYVYARDLLQDIEEDVRIRPCHPCTLQRARAAVRKAIDREKYIN